MHPDEEFGALSLSETLDSVFACCRSNVAQMELTGSKVGGVSCSRSACMPQVAVKPEACTLSWPRTNPVS